MTDQLEFQDWGLIDYEQALKKQLALLEIVHEKQSSGYLIFCTHPPVVTLGRATEANDLTGFKGHTVEVSRGGRATYHGPSQILIYAIVNLKFGRQGRNSREVVGFLRDFEKALVEVLKSYDVVAQGRSLQSKDAKSETDETGVWVGSQKIASLGIAVKKWVTYHGAALNVDFDPKAHHGIKPCGFEPSIMTSLEELKGQKIDPFLLKEKLHIKLLSSL
jgi:lipoyl(octanoyl) transferase